MSSREPDYGPRGYLPDRAARRARKIILREQMGFGWVLAALAAAGLLLVIGLVYLATRTGPPGPPFVEVAALGAVDPGDVATLPADDADVLVVRAGGGVQAFVAPQTPVVYCAESRRLEGADGSVWSLTGRRVGGPAPSLASLPVVVFDGRVFVDPSRPHPPPQPDMDHADPICLSD